MSRLFKCLSILIVPWMALVFAPSLAISATITGGTLTTDTTWTLAQSPYIITGTVTVQGVDGADGITTLTIEPGVELRFNASAYLYIGGYSGNPGALRAMGNASQLITFTSNQTTPWGGINFQNTSHDTTSLLTHCVVEKAGQSNIRIDSASPAIRQCSIRESSGYGININTGSPEISNCAISANSTYGVYNSGAASKPLLSGNTFTANGSYPLRIGANTPFNGNTFIGNVIQAVEIIGETITLDNTWRELGVPYHITSQISIQGTDGSDGVTTLTIEPGVEIRFNQNVYLYVGGSASYPAGALRAIGSESQPITFTSNQTSPWGGIYFLDTSNDATSLLDHCIVEKAAQMNIRMDFASPAIRHSTIRNSGAYGIYINTGTPEISDSTITGNKTYGVYCANTASKPLLTGNTFTANESYPLRIGANTPFTGNTFTGNTIQAVELFGETVSKDNSLKDIGVPYHVTSQVTIQGIDGTDGLTTLTIEPGVELRFSPNVYFYVGGKTGSPAGALRVIGSESKPITFTSNQTSPWGGIYFLDTSHDSTSVLDHCIVEKAAQMNIRIDSASPAIKHSIIRNSGAYGIYINTGTPEISDNTITGNKTYGVHCASATSKPLLTGNIFSANESYPLRIGANTPFTGNTFNGNTIQAVELFGETVSKDNSLKNIGVPYHITSQVTIQGTDGTDGLTTLTLEPGVELRFSPNVYLYVGGSAGYPAGALRAIGSESQPITFTSNQTSPWGGIYFLDTSHDSTSLIDYCIVEKAAQMNIRMDSASPAVMHSTIQNSGGYGIYINTGTPEIRDNIISSNTIHGLYCVNTTSKPLLSGNAFSTNGTYPVRIYAGTSCNGNTFKNNTIQAVEIAGETITLDRTWKNIGIPYHITGQVVVQGIDGADGVTTLTIESGVELRFNPNIGLYVGGASGNPGALAAQGNENHFITFTSNQTAPWAGITFSDTTRDNLSVLDHCIVEKAASSNIRLDSASPAIRRSGIRNSGSYGIYLNGTGCNSALIECNTIRNNPYGIFSSGCSQMIIMNNNITGNTLYGIYHTYSSKLNVTRNWWGIATGPGSTSNKVYGNVEAAPFLKSERNCDILPPTDDTDFDNLPDSWELQYFGDLNQNDEGDYDNDGITNVMEYILGSAPNDMDHITPNSIEFESDGAGRIIGIKK